MKRPHAFIVIDTDGSPCWGLVDKSKRLVSVWARHWNRRVARVEIVAICRKVPAKRRRR